MSNRNLNGLSSSVRSLNGLSTQLKDGKAIKIADENEIDVNFLTNTTEQTTLGDTDLFLLSDNLGSNIQYINGLRIKQQTNNSLVAGNNINFTTSGNHRQINVNDNIDTAGSITCKNFVKINNSGSGTIGGILTLESSNSQSSFPNRFKLQTSHLNSRDKFQIIGEDNASNQQILLEIDTGTNHGNTHTIDFKFAEFTNVNKINTYTSNNLQLNTDFNQFIIKKSTVNFSSGEILAVDSNSQLTNITATNIISNIVGGNNITRSVNTINLDTGLTGMVSIDGAGDLTLKRAGTTRTTIGSSSTRFHAFNTTLGGILLIDKGTGGQSNNVDYEILQDYLSGGFITGKIDVGLRIRRKGTDNYDQLFCGHLQDDGNCVMLKPNNDLNYIFKSGELKINKADLSSHDFIINLVNSASTFSVNNIATATLDCNTFKTCNSRLVAIRDSNDLYLFNNATLPAVVGNNNEFLKQSGDGSNLLLRANTIQFFNGTTEIMSLSSSTVDVKKLLTVSADGITNSSSLNLKISNTNKISILSNTIDIFSNTDFNQNILYLKGGGNANHYIRFRDVANIINGPRISGFGGSGRAVFDVVSQETTTDEVLFNILNDKINIYKPLYMNSSGASGGTTDRPIYLHTDTNFFIKYKFDSTSVPAPNQINGTEIAGFSGVRISNTRRNTTNIQTYSDHPITGVVVQHTLINGTLALMRDSTGNLTVDNDNNDTFVIRSDGFVRQTLYAQNANSQIILKSNDGTGAITFVHTSKDLVLSKPSTGQFKFSSGSVDYLRIFNSGTGTNGKALQFEMGGISGQSDGGFFQAVCSQGRMVFQNDRNLVVYRPDNSVAFSSGNSASSRDYKKNITDLVESESINIIKNINPVSFEYKEQYWDNVDACDNCNCNVRKGFIWEDIKPILPQTAKMINMDNPNENTTKLLDMKEIIPDLVKVNQYLLNEISTLKEQLLTQSNLISNLQSQINI